MNKIIYVDWEVNRRNCKEAVTKYMGGNGLEQQVQIEEYLEIGGKYYMNALMRE